MKITSPANDYTGTQVYGDTVIEFKDGVADVDELPAAVRSYMSGAGYGIGKTKAVEPDVPTPADPREVEGSVVGTRLRDAAVDPRPGDFLPPTNAGKPGEAGNPHGPNVVAPEIHASAGQAVVPGPVGRYEVADAGELTVVSDTDAQQARETEFAERSLVGNEPVPDVLADIAEKAAPAVESAQVDGDVDPEPTPAPDAEPVPEPKPTPKPRGRKA